MSFTPGISSGFNDTKNRSHKTSPQTGMCSFCSAECPGTCELGLSAVLGAQTVYPTNTGDNQIASEKDYPVDFSHFNINGRVFGAAGAPLDADLATIFNVKLEKFFGRKHTVKISMPVILPALIKLNWQDYFSGAAMAGVCCVIGEGSPSKDPKLEMQHGKISHFPFLFGVLETFHAYYRGYGQIVLQCNFEDDLQGLPEFAITKCGVDAIEFKFGQAAKGTQPVIRLKDYKAAVERQMSGILVHPNPTDTAILEAVEAGVEPVFYSYGRLPIWDETYLQNRIAELRGMGLKNVYFKMAGFDWTDIERILRMASDLEVDVVTFDGAGGGSGYSPCKMMNEWGLPTICLEEAVCISAARLEAKGHVLPAIIMTGGFATEDQVYKSLALGAPYITGVGLCRAAMAAANSAKKVGELILAGKTPSHLRQRGNSIKEVFADLPDLRYLYGKKADNFSPGAIGVFSYLNRIALGLRHFAALNRKFDIVYANKNDLIPLTQDAVELIKGAWCKNHLLRHHY